MSMPNTLGELLRGTKARVVIIEDGLYEKEILVETFENSDEFEIVGISDLGNEGFKLIQGLDPDIIVLDMGLPDISGEEVIERLRILRPNSRVVLFTSYSRGDTIVKCALSHLKNIKYCYKFTAMTDLLFIMRNLMKTKA
jgi:DNA-binding NarL/FixJ family response regulator